MPLARVGQNVPPNNPMVQMPSRNSRRKRFSISDKICLLATLGLVSICIWSAWDYGGGYLRTQAIVCYLSLALIPVGLLASWRLHREQSGFQNRSKRPSSIKSNGVEGSGVEGDEVNGDAETNAILRPKLLRNRSPFLLVGLSAIVWIIAAFQSLELSNETVKYLSQGSSDAVAALPEPLIEEAVGAKSAAVRDVAISRRSSVSVAPTYTRNALSIPALFGIACWLGTLCVSRRHHVFWVLLGTAVAGGVFAFFGLADAIRLARDTEVELRQRLIISPVGADNPFGPFVNNNTGAGYLNLAVGCALGVFGWAMGDRWRNSERSESHQPGWTERLHDWRIFASGILVVLLVAGIFGSQSRGGMLGMMVGFATLGATKLRGRAIVKSLVLIFAAFVVAWFFLGGLGMQTLTSDRVQTLTDGSALQDPRLQHWPDGLESAKHYLWMGAGFGTYRFAYLPYQSSSGSPWFINADGMHVEWLVEGGIWLLPIVFFGVVTVIRKMCRLPEVIAKAGSSDATIKSALLTSMVFIVPATLVTQSFDFGILQPPLLLTVAILCGVVMGTDVANKTSAETASEPTAKESISLRHHPIVALLVRTVPLVILIFGLFSAANDLRVSADVQEASRLRQKYLRSAASELPDFESSIAKLRQVVDANPRHSEAHLVLAELLISQQRRLGAGFLIDSQKITPQQATIWVSPRNVRRALHMTHVTGPLKIEELMLPPQSLDVWLEAREHALAALLLCPSDDRARVLLIELDMIHPAANRSSEQLLIQSARLRSRNDQSLRHLERLAAVSPKGECLEFIRDLRHQLKSPNE